MSDCLPQEVVTDILSRLPVKSLMRFRCVSKAWCSLISTPNFISTHLNRSLSNFQHQTCLFVCHSDENYENLLHTLLLYPSDQEIEQKRDFFACPSDSIQLRGIHPSERNKYFFDLVGSSNSLLCLAHKSSSLCVLWNPSIQKAISLPWSNLGFESSLNQYVGFGYEPTTDDYKFVRLVCPDTDYSCLNRIKPVPPLVDIYTLAEIYTHRTGTWRSITAPARPYVVKMRCSSVFVSGALHWAAHTPRRQGGFRNVILCFNMKDETFGEVGMPKSLQGLEGLYVSLLLLDGLLALFPHNVYYGYDDASHGVWVMKEYGVVESWTNLFDVQIAIFHKMLGFTKSGELLVIKAERLFSLRPSNRGYLENPPICGPKHIYLNTYVESLVLLNVADQVPGRQENSSGGS